MVSVHNSKSIRPGASTAQGHYVAFLGKTLYSLSASPHPGVYRQIGIGRFNAWRVRLML